MGITKNVKNLKSSISNAGLTIRHCRPGRSRRQKSNMNKIKIKN